MAKRKRKSFKFNDTVKTTSGQPIIGCIWEVNKEAGTVDITSFKTGQLWEVPMEIVQKISNRKSDSDYSRLYHKLG